MAALRNSSSGYGWVSIALHWAVAILLLGEIPLGYLTQATASQPALQFALYQWHKSFGFLVLTLAFLRIGWGLLQPHPAYLDMPRVEKVAARWASGLLLALTIAVPLAGWAIASSSPLGIPSFVFNLIVVPSLPLPVSDTWELRFSWAHAVLAYAAGGLACLHIAAALYHHLIRRDRTLVRMLFPR